MNAIKTIEEGYKRELAPFSIGDTVKVTMRVKEGEKERLQSFEGTVIARRGSGTRETFTVRKISYGVGVEKIFPIHSPLIQKVRVVKHGVVRRAKLYYLRGKRGKAAKIKEKAFYNR